MDLILPAALDSWLNQIVVITVSAWGVYVIHYVGLSTLSHSLEIVCLHQGLFYQFQLNKN